tara:strand:+ start:27892 stop:28338 length:447 start_codon:yes stop_codon:yes gene_type:complete
MSNIQEIESLLKKYLDAETTLQEEDVLRDYFNTNDVEPHLKGYKAMFTYFNISKEEKTDMIIEFPTEKTITVTTIKKRDYSWLRIAASIVIIVGVSYFGYDYKQQYDTQVAYENTQYALNLLSTNLNKGTSAISYLGEFDKTKKQIFK